MPSRREPFGIAYLEALRAGLPVVSLDLGAVPDFVVNGTTGYRVAVGDMEGLVARLQELLVDPARCQQMGEAGRKMVAERYTWHGAQQMMWRAISTQLSAASTALPGFR
jgi:glycosyltransferase involved in cell wall biosynthesis